MVEAKRHAKGEYVIDRAVRRYRQHHAHVAAINVANAVKFACLNLPSFVSDVGEYMI